MRAGADGSCVSYTQSILYLKHFIPIFKCFGSNRMEWALDQHFVGSRCLPLLTKMINFITVYFKLASKAFYIYSTSIILFPFLRFLLCRCMRWLYSVFFISTVGTTSNHFHFSTISACIAKACEKLSFILFFFHAMKTIQKSRGSFHVLFSHNRLGAVFISPAVGNCFSQWKRPQRSSQFIRHNRTGMCGREERRRNICEYRNCDSTFSDGFYVFQLNIIHK